MSTDKDTERWMRVVFRTANTISKALDNMFAGSPMPASPLVRKQAVEALVRLLAQQQQEPMQWIMEDRCIREAYDDAVSRLPTTVGGSAR